MDIYINKFLLNAMDIYINKLFAEYNGYLLINSLLNMMDIYNPNIP